MIEWDVVEDTNGKQRKFWGESNAINDAEILIDYQELWITLFKEQVPWYPRDTWNSFICGETVDTGNFAIELAWDLSTTKMQKGVSLTFVELRDYLEGDFDTDEKFDNECALQESRYITLLMDAWNEIKEEPSIRNILAESAIALRIINTPEENVPPVLDTILEL